MKKLENEIEKLKEKNKTLNNTYTSSNNEKDQQIKELSEQIQQTLE